MLKFQSTRVKTAARWLLMTSPLALVLLIAFLPLLRNPDHLIVDAQQPSVDHGGISIARPIGNDLTSLFLPRFFWISDAIREDGSVPQWDPRGFAGRPNLGNPQAGLWYPPIWPLWLIGKPASLGWLTVAHFFWSGIGLLVLCRALKISPLGSTLGAIIWMLNPYTIAQFVEGHLPHLWGVSWYPWAFFGGLLVQRGASVPGVVTVGVSLAMALLAGHPQEGLYLALGLMVWALVDLIYAIRLQNRALLEAERAPPGRTLLSWSLAMILAGGLTAVEWLPDLMARPFAVPITRGGTGPYHLYPSDALELLSPEALGGRSNSIDRTNHWESMLSIGLGPLVLLITAVCSRRERSRSRVWLFLLVLSLLHASGERLLLSEAVAKLIPGLAGLRVPARSLFLGGLAAAVLATIGFETVRLSTRRDAWRTLRALLVVLGILIALPLLDGPTRSSAWIRWTIGMTRIGDDPVFRSIGSGIVICFLLWILRPNHPRIAAFGIGGLAIVELVLYCSVTLPVTPPSTFLRSPDPLFSQLQTQDNGPLRIRARDVVYSDLDAYGDHLEKTNIGDLFQIRHASELVREIYPVCASESTIRCARNERDSEEIQKLLDRLGVRLLLSDRPEAGTTGPLVGRTSCRGVTLNIVRNPSAMPRAYVVPSAIVAGSQVSLDELLRIDPKDAVLLESVPIPLDNQPRQLFRPAKYEQIDADHVQVSVETNHPGFLVILNTWMPGWSAEVDGESTPVLRADHAFQAIILPKPGRHRIKLSYRTPGLRLGITLSLITLGILGLTITHAVHRRAIKKPA